jgi:hypothetical protein
MQLSLQMDSFLGALDRAMVRRQQPLTGQTHAHSIQCLYSQPRRQPRSTPRVAQLKVWADFRPPKELGRSTTFERGNVRIPHGGDATSFPRWVRASCHRSPGGREPRQPRPHRLCPGGRGEAIGSATSPSTLNAQPSTACSGAFSPLSSGQFGMTRFFSSARCASADPKPFD